MADEKKDDGLGISGFTLGIIGIVFAGIIGFIISVIGFSFCVIQQKKYKTKYGKRGIILNVIGIILSIAAVVASAVLFKTDLIPGL